MGLFTNSRPQQDCWALYRAVEFRAQPSGNPAFRPATRMIVSASYRTDIPAFYPRWFANRLAAGHCRVVNPYSGRPYTVPLAGPEVDGFVFWTRNLGPFMGLLDAVGAPFTVQYTITGYPRALDAATLPPDAAIAHLHALARRFGPRAGVWRYDPVLDSDATPPAFHRESFARIAGALRGAVDEVVVSFAQIYAKTRRNLDAARIGWRDPEAAAKQALLAELAAIAADCGMALTLCGQPELLVPGVPESRCIDANRLSDLANRPIAAAEKPHRARCACFSARDIGAYDTCPHGCAYCYAVRSRALARRRFAAHDPDSDFLVPPGPA